MLIDYFIVC